MAIALASVFQQGCGVPSVLRADLTAWEGHSIDELTASWGQPDRTEPLGTAYVAYTWVESGTGCEQTFTVSGTRITGYSSNGCND